MVHYAIVGHDNRGSDTAPFGRIYLSKSKRGDVVGSLGYTSRPKPSVWLSNQTPDDASPITVIRAKEYLGRNFPNIFAEAEIG
jgi:hypothetical protein